MIGLWLRTTRTVCPRLSFDTAILPVTATGTEGPRGRFWGEEGTRVNGGEKEQMMFTELYAGTYKWRG
jgi:hypothetical protein